MKLIRKISPFLSVILAFLMLAGSTGFTIVKHQCYFCGHKELKSSIELAVSGDDICCNHEFVSNTLNHNPDDFVFDIDSCSHETEKLISEDVVRSEVQPDIIPYFIAAVHTLIINHGSEQGLYAFRPDKNLRCSRDLTTLYCQILS